MRPSRPSRFFQQRALQASPPPPGRRRLTRTQRRLIAWLVVGSVLLLVAAVSIYLAHPERWRQPGEAQVSQQPVAPKMVQKEPGVVEVEVDRDGRKQTLRLRRVGDKLAVEDVTPREEKSWWERLWGK